MSQPGNTEQPAHGGAQAVAAARAYGAQTMFTLSGGHVFPLYDGAVKADPPMRIVDVRHEQTAVFAAEATARLTRSPGFAVLTAGPGVTNGVSAVTTAHFNGTPLVVLAGRAPDGRWGSGSLQELDHPPLLAPVTKRAWTAHAAGEVGTATGEAFALATARHRGPVFLDASLEALFGPVDGAGSMPTEGLRRLEENSRLRPPARHRQSRRRPARRIPIRRRLRASRGCWPRRSGRCWCSGRTCGWMARKLKRAQRRKCCSCPS